MNKQSISAFFLDKEPLVTFMLLTYNQERFIYEAVHAALNQDYSRLEIIISDDYSNDATFDIINDIISEYTGPHEVIINKNLVNLGLANHFNKIVASARGDIIVVAAGDDISVVNRVSKTVEILCANPEASIVSFTDILIDEDGKKISKHLKRRPNTIRQATLDDYIEGCAHFSAASRGFRKRIFNVFGDLNDTCQTEDTPYLLRGLLIGHALASSECGILYRQHDKNLSGLSSLHLMNTEEIKKQYLRDTELAFTAGLITEKSKYDINNWIEKNKRRRDISNELFKEHYKFNFFCTSVMPSKDFKFREKIGILKSILIKSRLFC